MPISAQAEAALTGALDAHSVPRRLTSALIDATEDLLNHYSADRLRPAELSGGDFAEAAVRILQHLARGTHTPLGKTLPRFPTFLAEMERAGQLDDSLRVHVPRALQMIYDVRNRRGVGHLAGAVSPNRSDAELVLTIARWVIAEFIRVLASTPIHDAQKVVDALAQRDIPGVESFEGTRRVTISRGLSVTTKVLLLLLSADPAKPTRQELVDWTRADPQQLRTAVRRLDGRDLVHVFRDGRVTLTARGRGKAEEELQALRRARS